MVSQLVTVIINQHQNNKSIYNNRNNPCMKKTHESFHQQLQLCPEQALILSNPIPLQFPSPTPLQSNIFSTLASYIPSFGYSNPNTVVTINNNRNMNDGNGRQFLPIPDQFFLMVCRHCMRIYRHAKNQQEQLDCELIHQLTLSFPIKCVKISPFTKHKPDKNFYFIAQDSSTSTSTLTTLYYDISQHCIKQVSTVRMWARINCWAFIANHEILVWCSNMKMYHYHLREDGLRLVQMLETGVRIGDETVGRGDEGGSRSKSKSRGKVETVPRMDTGKNKNPFTLNYCAILGQRGNNQDSIIVLFYVLYNESQNFMKIKCKQILYPFQSTEPISNRSIFSFRSPSNPNLHQFPKLQPLPKTHQLISHNTTSPEILNTISIIKIKDIYMIRSQFEIIVVQKKFNQEYFAIDNIYKKNKQCKVSMAYNSNIVSCITNNILELNKFQIDKGKVKAFMIDFIDLESQEQGMRKLLQEIFKQQQNTKEFKIIKDKIKLIQMWISADPLHQNHRNNIYFVFEVVVEQGGQQKSHFIMYLTKHTSRVKKLIALAHKTQKPQEIVSIQKLGKGLGVTEEEFYYNMWKTSKRGADDITAYLLKCKNYMKIIAELKGFLRKRSFAATRLQKVLQLLQELTLEILQKDISEQYLIDYFHVMFINRKFLIYESNYQIDQRQFTQMVEISLYDLVKKIINNELFPQVKTQSVWAPEPIKPPKLNLIQVLGYFKLTLLEDYDQFLAKILNQYPDNIINVIRAFPQFLPNYPFQDLIINQANTSFISKLSHQASKISQKQKQFFSPIKNQHIKAQPLFLENVLDKLYPFYSTSRICKTIDQTMTRPQLSGKKFIFHTIISTNKQTYKTKIKAMTDHPNYLYNVALDCLIKNGQKDTERDAQIKLENMYEKISQLCEIFGEVHKIEGTVLEEIDIMACFFELMICKEIIDVKEIDLNQFVSEPMEKWIALFFLGNKQQKQLIFKQFMHIFPVDNSNKFISALQNFIDSQHCSKIQLSILMDLLKETDKDFQKNNQKIIDLVINGFCARVQVSDSIDAGKFRERLSSIKLGHQLLVKADMLDKLGVCHIVLEVFYLEHTLIKDLMEKPHEVIDNILQNFFNSKMKPQSSILIPLQDRTQTLSLTQVSDTFTLLYFLREYIFFDITTEQLLKLYCRKLISWQIFDVIHELLYNSEQVKNFNIDLQKLIEEVQEETLNDLHQLDNFSYTELHKQYINKILDIDTNAKTNPVVIREKARIQISDIFLTWDVQVKVSQIEDMLRAWEKTYEASANGAGGIEDGTSSEVGDRDIMNEIIETYAKYLNLKSLQKLYQCFLIAISRDPQLTQKSQRFYRYCTSLCDALLTHSRFRQACQIICIVNQMFEMNYMLMAECMLQSLYKIYTDAVQKEECRGQLESDNSIVNSEMESQRETQARLAAKEKRNYHYEEGNDNIVLPSTHRQLFSQAAAELDQSQQILQILPPLEVTKLYMDYFIIHWINQDQQRMNYMFSKFFDLNTEVIPTLDDVHVDPKLCYNQVPGRIKSDFLWELVKTACESDTLSRMQVLYGYFFIVMGLFEPDIGFRQIDYISYNHEILVNILIALKDECQKNQKQLLFLNYAQIFKKYLDALTIILILKHKETSQTDDDLNQSKTTDKNPPEQISMQNLSHANLATIREEFLRKGGEFKDDPLLQHLNKMRELYGEAEKNCKKRFIIFNNTKSVKNFVLGNQSKLKMTMRKTMKMGHQQSQNQDNSKMQKNQKQAHMISFEQYSELKKKIKNERSFHELPEFQLSQRTIAEEIFNSIEPGPKGSARSLQKKKDIPGLQQIINISLKELQIKQKMQEIQRQKIDEQQQNDQQEVYEISKQCNQSDNSDYEEKVSEKKIYKMNENEDPMARLLAHFKDRK